MARPKPVQVQPWKKEGPGSKLRNRDQQALRIVLWTAANKCLGRDSNPLRQSISLFNVTNLHTSYDRSKGFPAAYHRNEQKKRGGKKFIPGWNVHAAGGTGTHISSLDCLKPCQYIWGDLPLVCRGLSSVSEMGWEPCGNYWLWRLEPGLDWGAVWDTWNSILGWTLSEISFIYEKKKLSLD
jgi:hypothetical protein